MDWSVILLIVLMLGVLGFQFVQWRKLQEPVAPPAPPDTSGFVLMQNQMHQLTQTIDAKLLDVIRGVAENKESNKQVFTIAEQLGNLEKVLKNQKQRGNLGEASLELVMSNILPPGAYAKQYEFPGGETVDAIIRSKTLKTLRIWDL